MNSALTEGLKVYKQALIKKLKILKKIQFRGPCMRQPHYHMSNNTFFSLLKCEKVYIKSRVQHTFQQNEFIWEKKNNEVIFKNNHFLSNTVKSISQFARIKIIVDWKLNDFYLKFDSSPLLTSFQNKKIFLAKLFQSKKLSEREKSAKIWV